jgi:putative hydrolase of the HAD superfamily
MQRPGLVIFDMDDVLCHYDLGRRLRVLAALADTTARDVRAAIWDSGFEDSSDAGGYPDGAEYLQEFGRRLGYPLRLEEWLSARRVSMTPIAETLAMARSIGTQADLALFTNNGPLVKDNLGDLFPEAAALFPLVFCSYEFGTKKPDPDSFRRMLAHTGHGAQDAWFIDDKRSNVQGARLAGLTGHHYRNPDLLREAALSLGFEL